MGERSVILSPEGTKGGRDKTGERREWLPGLGRRILFTGWTDRQIVVALQGGSLGIKYTLTSQRMNTLLSSPWPYCEASNWLNPTEAKGQPPGVWHRLEKWEEWGWSGNGKHPTQTTIQASSLRGSFNNRSPLGGHWCYFQVLLKPWFSRLVEKGGSNFFILFPDEVFKLTKDELINFFLSWVVLAEYLESHHQIQGPLDFLLCGVLGVS